LWYRTRVRRSTRIHVAILFGGRSGEHEISLRSARSVVNAIDRDRFELSLVGIDHAGAWYLLDEAAFLALTVVEGARVEGVGTPVTLSPSPVRRTLVDLANPTRPLPRLDVVFPILHGTFGEDGTIQGLLDLADLPYVGAGVLGSAVGMDKDVQKRLLREAGISVVPFVAATRRQWTVARDAVQAAVDALGLPLFVKPANLGSSVGITKVTDPRHLPAAVAAALDYDTKALIEAGIDGRELECAVLGNDEPAASVPGEIRPRQEFYSYEAKYIDAEGAVLLIPAPLSPDETATVQRLALQAFQVLECAGMARVDFFLERKTGTLYVNEINTIPGFTAISMYPKLWEHSGTPYTALITGLIELALERHAERAGLVRTFELSHAAAR
jgi:D-alanine-D-alanine ligase